MLEINKLSFGYHRKSLLINNVTLSLQAGHIYGLLGRNGAGKTTLLKNMVGLATPGKGNCLFKGLNTAGRPVAVLEDIFFIPEEIFVPSLSPRRFVANTAGFYPKFQHENFYRHLQALDVDPEGLMDKQSYGQQKKAMIAFGLAANTGLLVMDEPTNGLDIPSKIQFRKLIASVQNEQRCIIISTHQVRDLDSLIDTLLVLHDSEIVVNQSLDRVVEKLYFGQYSDTAGMPVLYEEENIRGKLAILLNDSGEFSRPDIELLFNAVISGNPALLEILKPS